MRSVALLHLLKSWFVALPDSASAAAVARLLLPYTSQRAYHPSGRPWLLGRWPGRRRRPRLSSGLDTDVGEHGRLLSGGERQRVAIARCLLARPSVLLLDEPTAHLDPVNEAALARTIDEISRVCALLVIAHRFATVRRADRVVLLRDGTVAAQGGHEALADDPFYRKLVAASA